MHAIVESMHEKQRWRCFVDLKVILQLPGSVPIAEAGRIDQDCEVGPAGHLIDGIDRFVLSLGMEQRR